MAKDPLFNSDRRNWLFRKLERIMGKVAVGRLPMVITEVYLFGSFLRLKESPADIDILLIYDSDRTLQMYETMGRKGDLHWRFWDVRKSPSRLRGMLKKNAERSVDINICPSLKEFQRNLAYAMDTYLRIWSTDDCNWHSTLKAYFQRPEAVPIAPEHRSRAARSAKRCRSPQRSHCT